jgi:hypothetical protein
VAEVAASYEDAADSGVIQETQEASDGTLARARRTHERYCLAWAHRERKVAQHLPALVVSEVHIVELNRPLAANRTIPHPRRRPVKKAKSPLFVRGVVKTMFYGEHDENTLFSVENTRDTGHNF